jgi:hypothetical protein
MYRRLLKWTCFTIGIAAVAAIATCAIWFQKTGGRWTDDHIKASSPFHRFVDPWVDRESEDEIRRLVLSEVPIGSSFRDIERFVERHFIDFRAEKRTEAADPDDPVEQTPHVYIRAWQAGYSPSGSDWMDFIFVLDASDCVKDVQVSCNGNWL